MVEDLLEEEFSNPILMVEELEEESFYPLVIVEESFYPLVIVEEFKILLFSFY